MRNPPRPVTAADVRSSAFTPTRFREGYDQSEVDTFLEEVAVTLEHKETGQLGESLLSADQVLNKRFRASKLTPGYDQAQVDDLLDRVVITLRPRPAAPVAPIDGGPHRSAQSWVVVALVAVGLVVALLVLR